MNMENLVENIETKAEVSMQEPSAFEGVVQLGNRIMGFMEKHPAVPVIVFSVGIFGSMGKAAIKSGWTPEQVVGLGKAFPVQVSIPALSL